uniref:Uncharacterized protein n=1 Tax=Setaria viridis TaxID=4556 RepID=A0A4U6VAY5_SETVI|nr:hypothetical protein SEVIR_3G130866v2 [Setaria viridis]
MRPVLLAPRASPVRRPGSPSPPPRCSPAPPRLALPATVLLRCAAAARPPRYPAAPVRRRGSPIRRFLPLHSRPAPKKLKKIFFKMLVVVPKKNVESIV